MNSRREALEMMVAGSAAVLLPACGSSSGGDVNPGDGASGAGSSGDGSPVVGGGDRTNTTRWLAGGTAAMQAEFPPTSDPLDLSLGNVMCTVTGTDRFTIGPCYFDTDDFREDISEGQPGVPMTLALKLVDADCNPIMGAIIEVWWVNWEGVYSGDNSGSTGNVSNFNSGFCTENDSDALSAKWFRGVQTTDSIGNVYFRACFPGWYRGRTTHIHFRVVVEGVERLVSQFGFDDDLANDIYLNHSDYTGQRKDTNNDSDSVFRDGILEHSFLVEEQWDGSMLAYKGIQIV